MATPIEFSVLGGTDGFRDVATDEPGPGRMNPETIAGLTSALIDYQQERGASGPVVIAQDTRPSGLALRNAALSAAYAHGIDTIDVGIVPTPAAQKVAAEVGALATVVLTASHNPSEYNGWKGMLGSSKPTKEDNKEISWRYWQKTKNGFTIPVGRPENITDEQAEWSKWYVNKVVLDIEKEFGVLPLTGKLFIIDGAHGAASSITPEVFRKLGARVEPFSCDDGTINKNCGAAHLDGLKHFLQENPKTTIEDPSFIGALANDGDADRVMGIGVSENNELVEINGNQIMEAIALNPKQRGIVGTIYTNSATRDRLKNVSVGFLECDNGDTYVTSSLLAKQAAGEPWSRGGEFTGHLIDTSWLNSGDGVRTAAWFAAFAAQSGQTFGEIHSHMPLWPEGMQKVDLPKGTSINIGESQFVQAAISRVLDAGARPIVRASGTEPLVRVWCEAPSSRLVGHSLQLLRDSVLREMEEAR